MIIREATDVDISEIVSLLRKSLGQSLVKKTVQTWQWKHKESPFGESPVLVAVENNQIVGVRAFMQWEFEKNSKTYKALRAVDTATHPDHQGKGIFKKLTLALIDHVKTNDFDFIFNTPNEQSKPGYLKMGWKEIRQVPLRLKLFIFTFSNKANPSEYLIDLSKVSANKYKLEYYSWRYAKNPLASYYQLNFGEFGVAFFRVKKNRFLSELRICDIIIDQTDVREFRRSLSIAAKTFNCRIISIGNYPLSINPILSRVGFLPTIYKGLLLTARKVNTEPKAYFESLSTVDMDLGTFELF